jgi:TPR repeat protein
MGRQFDTTDRSLVRLGGILAAAAVALTLWSGTANADFAAGVAAYEAGDFAAAFEQWLPEAEAGNDAAQRNIGLLYQSGRGVTADPGQAVFWYQKAAEAGNARAQANLGNLYLSGDGVPQDYGVAANWFELAARQGHVVSQFNLGLMYENGLGVEANRLRALEWYAMAAESGHPAATEQHRILLAQRPPDPAPLPLPTPAPAPAPPPEPVVVAHTSSRA